MLGASTHVGSRASHGGVHATTSEAHRCRGVLVLAAVGADSNISGATGRNLLPVHAERDLLS